MGMGSWQDVDKPRRTGSFFQIEDGETKRIRVLDEAPWIIYTHRIRQNIDGQEVFLTVPETAKPDEDYISGVTNRYPAQPVYHIRIVEYDEDGEPIGVKILSGGVKIFRPMKGFVERHGDIREFDLEISLIGAKRETDYSVTIAPRSFQIDVAEWLERADREMDMDALLAPPSPEEQREMVEKAKIDLTYDPAEALMTEMTLDEAMNKRFPFGKKYGPEAYPPNGKKIGEIAAIDAGFVQWAADNVTSDDSVAAACRLVMAHLAELDAGKPVRGALAGSKAGTATNTGTVPAAAKGTQGKAAPVAAEWPLKMTPAEYLEKFPNGPKAELARTLVAVVGAPQPAGRSQTALVAEVMDAFNAAQERYPEPTDIVNVIKKHGDGKTRVKDLTVAQLQALLTEIRG